MDWIEINKLRPHPKNPNKHSKEQIERLAEIIKYQGWRHPIIVSKNSGFIVAGHGRLEAAKKLGLKTVPVHEQEFLDDEQEYAFIVSDNSIASWANLDLASINLEIGNLGPDFKIELLGLRDFLLEPMDKFNPDAEWTDLPLLETKHDGIKIVLTVNHETLANELICKLKIKVKKFKTNIWSGNWPQ